MERILVIKLGALGDFVQATGAFADIRSHHGGAHITLLTTRAMLPFALEAPFFDAIEVDARRPFWHLPYLCGLRRKLRGFDRVYDLQTNQRSGWYFWLAGRPTWSGIARGCALPHKNPDRNTLHTLERLADQLKDAGVPTSHEPNITYAAAPCDEILQKHALKRFVALVPGGAAHRPGKRWPHYGKLIQLLKERGHPCVLIGGPDETDLLENLARKTGAINLGGQASLNQLISLFSKADAVIGNDTGPMHLAAASGLKKGVVLFGPESDPALCAPRGRGVAVLHNLDFAAISPQEVLAACGLTGHTS